MLITRDNAERFPVPSSSPFRLNCRLSEEMLGELEVGLIIATHEHLLVAFSTTPVRAL
jgi:hypothetical protein